MSTGHMFIIQMIFDLAREFQKRVSILFEINPDMVRSILNFGKIPQISMQKYADLIYSITFKQVEQDLTYILNSYMDMFGGKKIKNMELIDPSNYEERHLEPTHLISYDWIESLQFTTVKNFNLEAVTRKFKNLNHFVIR
jgi:hypothetical protein